MSNTFSDNYIMVVDDTPANLDILKVMLTKEGYSVKTFENGPEALAVAEANPPDMLLLDITMPIMSGYEVCEHFKESKKTRDVPVIFLSALSETSDKVKAFTVGGVDYVTKPFSFQEVRARVETHLKLRHTQDELSRYNSQLQELVQEKVQDILQTKDELMRTQLATILAMSKIAEARDHDTGMHIERSQEYCKAVAERLQTYPEYSDRIDTVFLMNIYHASPLHDIGKVAIPDAILLKPGKLTDAEFEIMKTHTTIGSQTLEDVRKGHLTNSFISMGASIARSHHEKWDGTGYPDGLAGDDIPLPGQIMAFADVYDALRSERCYKKPFSHEKSRDIIIEGIGTQFAPGVGKAFIELEQEFAKIADELSD